MPQLLGLLPVVSAGTTFPTSACLLPSLSLATPTSSFPLLGSLPLPQGRLSAGPPLGQQVSGAGQAERLLPGELRPVGRGQEGLVPGQKLKEGTGRGPCAKSQGEFGVQYCWGLGVGETGGGARGLWQIRVCIWQSDKRQLSEAGPLASWRGELQGPGDTPPPRQIQVSPSSFPRLNHPFLWMILTMLSSPLRIWGSCCSYGANRCPWGS